MTRQALDALLFVLNALTLVFLLVLLSAPDVIGRGIEWVLA